MNWSVGVCDFEHVVKEAKIKRYHMEEREYICIHIHIHVCVKEQEKGREKKVEVKCFRKQNDEDNRLGSGA